MPITFGQAVIGPPGSGKSTYCKSMAEFLRQLKRSVVLVNLDPANDMLPYEADIDISELISLEDAMKEFKLGPNGGLMYCMEFLETNADWLLTKLANQASTSSAKAPPYVLFDLPGQVELFTHHESVKNILAKLQKGGHHLATVNLCDSLYCVDPSKFVSVMLASLSSMVLLEMPHVNVLSKADLVERYGKLPFGLDFYTDVLDLNYLVDTLQGDPFLKKYRNLTKSICGVIEDYSLVSFVLLDISKKESMWSVLSNVDRANGYCYGGGAEESAIHQLLSTAMPANDPSRDWESLLAEGVRGEEDGGDEV